MSLTTSEVESEVTQWQQGVSGPLPDIRVEAGAPGGLDLPPGAVVEGRIEYQTQNGVLTDAVVTIYADGLDSIEDVDATLNHEILGHYDEALLPAEQREELTDWINGQKDDPNSPLADEWAQVEQLYSDSSVWPDEVWAFYVSDPANWSAAENLVSDISGVDSGTGLDGSNTYLAANLVLPNPQTLV